MTRLLLVGLLAACSADAPRVSPVLDLPPTGSEADPFDGINGLRLAVAQAGDDGNLLERTVEIPASLSLQEIPFGEDLVIHISGLELPANEGDLEIEVAYGRTCPFDVSDAGPTIAAPHLYFSRVVKWGPGPMPDEPTRSGGHAYGLPDGSAIFAGGGQLSTIERFDPLGTGRFRTLDSELAPRSDSVLAPLPDGRALLIGGRDANGDAEPTVEVLSPERGLAVEAIDGPRLVDHAATALVDGRVLATGGQSQSQDGGEFTVTTDAWSFRFGEGGVLEAPRQLPVSLATARANHSMTRLGDDVGADVLIVGGRDGAGGAVAEVELYRPLRESFESLPGATLNIPRWGHQAIRLPGGFILIVGGFAPNFMGQPVRVPDTELYDPVQGRFNIAGLLPVSAGLTEMGVTALPDGRVLLTGGRDRDGDPVSTVLIARLDPINGQVDISVTNALDQPRAGHGAVLLCDGTVLLSGGTDDADLASERYNPPSVGRR